MQSQFILVAVTLSLIPLGITKVIACTPHFTTQMISDFWQNARDFNQCPILVTGVVDRFFTGWDNSV